MSELERYEAAAQAMYGNLESLQQDLAEEREFREFRPEVRQAALEYARGLARAEPPPPAPSVNDPDFLVIGLDGGTLLVSQALTSAKFAQQVDRVDRVEVRPGMFARIPRMTYIVGATMGSFDQIIGDDYRSALGTLLGEWQRREQAARHPRSELPPPG